MSNSNLIPFKTSNAEGWFVKVPDEATNITISKYLQYWHSSWDLPSRPGTKCTGGSCFFYKDLGGKKKYPEKLVFLCLASEITEYQAISLCEYFEVGDGEPAYLNYFEKDRYLNTAISSFKSLMDSLGALTGSWAVILKK